MAEHSHSTFRGLYDMFAEMSRMREHWTHVEPTHDRGGSAGAWVPTVDIYAHGDDLVIRCELAGIPKEDVDVSVSNGQLWISGERTGAPDEGDEITHYVRERRFGPFRRIINLPDTVDGDRLRATMENGLLEVVIEGGAVAKGHERIDIAGADPGEITVDVSRDQ